MRAQLETTAKSKELSQVIILIDEWSSITAFDYFTVCIFFFRNCSKSFIPDFLTHFLLVIFLDYPSYTRSNELSNMYRPDLCFQANFVSYLVSVSCIINVPEMFYCCRNSASWLWVLFTGFIFVWTRIASSNIQNLDVHYLGKDSLCLISVQALRRINGASCTTPSRRNCMYLLGRVKWWFYMFLILTMVVGCFTFR